VIREASLELTHAGLVPTAEGWFVLNARDGRWVHAEGRGSRLTFEGEPSFVQLGISLFALEPGEPMSMYHWEADQEDFLVLSGEALLIVEGEEHTLRRWDFVHCPPHTKHVIIGAGAAPCAVLAVGAREHGADPNWGGYPIDETALRHEAGVERETTIVDEAYAHVPRRRPTARRPRWMFGD
jgi:uncharacterized cupin superfamily protein